ncbi:MAG: class I SAM-dependent methyltransferase [Alphaproteobacteria bacterium]|nr:class I SAM-dependent methyltransferase [Alphaproteobacteria bacterium]
MNESLKSRVKSHWENEVCGTRNLADDIDRYEKNRAEFEPFIAEFADYGAYAGKRVLEIGVGGGADYTKFLAAGAEITGIDLTEAAIAFVRSRLDRAGQAGDLRTADAENLPFADGTFDLVYSYGVLHHSPDTERALAEAFRVLKPGGTLKVMVYSDFSMAGLMLWAMHGLLKGRPFRGQREIMFEKLESPGTKCYGNEEFRSILEGIGFRVTKLYKKAGAGDLLHMEASGKYAGGLKGAIFAVAKALLPRGLIRRFEGTLGLFLLAVAVKPAK